MTDKKARLNIDGYDKEIELDVYEGTMGPDVIDVAPVLKHGHFTYDPGFTSTASCESAITFIDGHKGKLLHRGIPIEQIAEKTDYLNLCYLLYYGHLPDKEQEADFKSTITRHTIADSGEMLTQWQLCAA
jgi:citrate synthase